MISDLAFLLKLYFGGIMLTSYVKCENCGRINYMGSKCCCEKENQLWEFVMINDNNAPEVPHLLFIGKKDECIAMWQDRVRAYKDVDHMGFPLNVTVKNIGDARLSVPANKWAGLKLVVRIRK
jgi:hypothetical protein